MKNIVISDEFTAKDFKPSSLLKEYLQLTEKDTAVLFAKGLKASACPGCGSAAGNKAFVKFGLNYQRCAQCRTLYVAPRPSDTDIERFYKDSAARRFWNDNVYKNTAGSRQAKIIKPRLQWIEDSTQEYLPKARTYVDINANQPGYIKEIGTLSVFQTKTLLNPLVPLTAGADAPGVEVRAEAWWQAQGQWDAVSLFEVLDHTSDVNALMGQVHGFLPQGGLCFLTAILASGFDISILGEHADNIYAPDRLNVFSAEGLKQLMARHGFEILEFSTPGILDVDMVARAVRDNVQVTLSPFLRDVVLNSDAEVRRSFQEFLQSNLLSSYGRMLIRKIN